jgi:SAM-dependent methyltransferase
MDVDMGSANVQGDLWGQEPSNWTNFQEPNHIPLWNAMLDATKVYETIHFLDAGCGGGGASVLAAKRGARVTGIDAAEGLISIAQERIPDGDFRVGDIQFLPFENNSFDVVFAANSIQYAEDSVAALRDLGRVCKLGGKIVVALFSAPEKVQFRTIIKALSGTLPKPPSGEGPFALSAPGKLENLFSQAGLKVIYKEEVNCPFEYPDFETFWRAIRGAGPTQGIMRMVGEEKVKSALQTAVQPFQNKNGSIHIGQNVFRYLVATP